MKGPDFVIWREKGSVLEGSLQAVSIGTFRVYFNGYP